MPAALWCRFSGGARWVGRWASSGRDGQDVRARRLSILFSVVGCDPFLGDDGGTLLAPVMVAWRLKSATQDVLALLQPAAFAVFFASRSFLSSRKRAGLPCTDEIALRRASSCCLSITPAAGGNLLLWRCSASQWRIGCTLVSCPSSLASSLGHCRSFAWFGPSVRLYTSAVQPASLDDRSDPEAWSKSLYDWRLVSQYGLVSNPSWGSWPDSSCFVTCDLCFFLISPSDEGVGLTVFGASSLSAVPLMHIRMFYISHYIHYDCVRQSRPCTADHACLYIVLL
jgi:hypothetical protein